MGEEKVGGCAPQCQPVGIARIRESRERSGRYREAGKLGTSRCIDVIVPVGGNRWRTTMALRRLHPGVEMRVRSAVANVMEDLYTLMRTVYAEGAGMARTQWEIQFDRTSGSAA